MFDQLKDLYKLKQQAEELQKKLNEEKITASSGVVTITINGNHDLLNVEIDPNVTLSADLLAKDFKNAFSDAEKRLKSALAEKFKGMI